METHFRVNTPGRYYSLCTILSFSFNDVPHNFTYQCYIPIHMFPNSSIHTRC